MTLPFVPRRADNVRFRVVPTGGAFDPVPVHRVCPETEGGQLYVKFTDAQIFFFSDC